MVTVDIPCDLMDVDETGYIWAFLDDALRPELFEPGAIVGAGDTDSPSVAEVVEVVDRPAGRIVHLRPLPGTLDAYAAMIRRVTRSD